MRVLFVPGWYPGRSHPTLGNFVQRHAAAVATLHEVTVLHAMPDPGVRKLDVVSGRNAGITEHIAYFKPGNMPVKERWLAWRELVRSFGDGHDIIHGHVLHAAIMPLWMLRGSSGGRSVLTEHWTGYLDGKVNELPFPVRWMMRQMSARAARICPVSDNLGQAMHDAGLAGRYTTVQNVVDTALFKPRPRTDRAPMFRFLHVSTLMDEQKNISGMLRAFRSAWEEEPRLAMDVISDGDIAPHRAFAEALGLPATSITFTGASSSEQVAERMSASDALVLFSRRENMPCVLAEAFASGIPVVATDVGGISEHLTPERGILVGNGDEDGLRTAFLTLSRTSEAIRASDLRDYAVRHFSMAEVAKAYDTIYRETLADQ